MTDKTKHGWIYTLVFSIVSLVYICLLYTSDAADDLS